LEKARCGIACLLLAVLVIQTSCDPASTPASLAAPPGLPPRSKVSPATTKSEDDSGDEYEYQAYLPEVIGTAVEAPANWWLPSVGASWQWQLSGSAIDTSFDVEVYDIDLFDTEASTVSKLHAQQGRRVICYISAGSWEDWRPDADQFPASVLGNDYEGWPGEKWLDIRRIDLLAPAMRGRLDQCQAKGFDGVEPDNIDAYTNDTGFPLTYQDQIDYNVWLAGEAHARGLSIGLKNDSEQVGDLLPHFDWALTEDCFAQEWCAEVVPFVIAGKAVFAAEYTDELTLNQFRRQVCHQAKALGFSAILKDRDLDAWRRDCP
jgi:endo-alpha-1,4-polygalactosaminidase (GH114 family)